MVQPTAGSRWLSTFILCQNIWFLLFLVPKLCLRSGKKILYRVQGAMGHMITPTSRPLFPALSPCCYRNVKKAYYSCCQGNYLLFQIQRGVTCIFHDHSCCSLKRNQTQWLVCHPTRTDSIINGPTSSDYFYFILYLSCWSSCHSLRTATFSTTWLSCTQPPEL